MRTTLHASALRLAVTLAVAVAVTGCGDDDDDATAPTSASVADATTEPPAASVASVTTVAATTDAVDTTNAADTTAAVETTTPVGTPYTSAEGDYSVVFPGEPSETTQAQPLPDGSEVDLVLVGYELDDAFMATARGQYPDGYVLDVPVALQGAQDQALANVGATLVSSEDITLQGRPGKQFSATLSSGGETGTLLQRVYLDGLVIYQQVFTGAGERSFTDADLAAFFDSFTFTTG